MGKGSAKSSGDTYFLNDSSSDAVTDEYGFYINGHSPEKVERMKSDFELYGSMREWVNDYEGGVTSWINEGSDDW